MSDVKKDLAPKPSQSLAIDVHPPVKREYHTHEWSSGTRGGGKVPADLEWKTNPKQWQEEYGAALPVDVAHGPVAAIPALGDPAKK